MMALREASAESSVMRLMMAASFFSHPMAVTGLIDSLAALMASRTLMPMARARQYASRSGVISISGSCSPIGPEPGCRACCALRRFSLSSLLVMT